MTYPQQPFGGQDPYGQNPYGQDPYGQSNPYGQGGPGYGYGPQYAGGGYGPPPPPKKNTGAVVAVIAAVVLVVGGLGFTGFVAPGFFLSGDDKQAGGGGTTSTQKTTSAEPTPNKSGGEEVLDKVVDGLDTQDGDALTDLVCDDAKRVVKRAIDDVDDLKGAKLVDTKEVGDDELVGTVEVTNGRASGEVEVTVAEADGDWCWQDIEKAGGSTPTREKPGTSEPSTTSEPTATGAPSGDAPTANGKPVLPEALAMAEGFLSDVNSGNAAAAAGRLCSDAIKTAAEVEEVVGAEPNLAINPEVDGNSSSERTYQLYLKGSSGGREFDGHTANVWVTKYTGTWCVYAFRVPV